MFAAAGTIVIWLNDPNTANSLKNSGGKKKVYVNSNSLIVSCSFLNIFLQSYFWHLK